MTIDFEASCLPRHGRSFPIEVGVCGPLGTCSWLIRPKPEWREWCWSEEAFGVHGITREQLDAEGLAPELVIAEVRRTIGMARVVSDSPIDRVWWQTLLDAAEPAISPAAPGAIVIENIADVLDELGATAGQIEFAQQRADRLCPERHRAGPDARWLFTLLTTLSEQIKARRHELRKTFPSWSTTEAYLRSAHQSQTANRPDRKPVSQRTIP